MNMTLFTAPRNFILGVLLNEFGDGREGAPTAWPIRAMAARIFVSLHEQTMGKVKR